MTFENFCYWLQGYFELTGITGLNGLTPDQANIIIDHLNLVFDKKTPDYTHYIAASC